MHATAAQVHECHERVSVMEAECPASDGPDLSVEPLGSGVRESRADVFDDTVKMPLDRVGDSSEVAQAGRPRLRDPLHEASPADIDLTPVEDVDERLLEEVGRVQRLVGVTEFLEGQSIGIGEVPRALLRRDARALESSALAAILRGSDLVSAGLVQRVLNEPLHMEAIEDHARLGHVLLDRLDERTRHVDGDRLELRGPFGPQSLEERGQRLGALALAGPHDRAALVVDDGRDVLVVLAVAELVDADVAEAVEARVERSEVLVNHALDDSLHRAPGGPQRAADECQSGVLGEVGTALLEGPREVAVVGRPGDLLGRGPSALPALDAPNFVPEVDLPAAAVEVPPPADPAVVDPAAPAAALRAPRHPPVRADVGDEAVGVEVEPRHEDVVDGEQHSE